MTLHKSNHGELALAWLHQRPSLPTQFLEHLTTSGWHWVSVDPHQICSWHKSKERKEAYQIVKGDNTPHKFLPLGPNPFLFQHTSDSPSLKPLSNYSLIFKLPMLLIYLLCCGTWLVLTHLGTKRLFPPAVMQSP